MKGEYNFYLRGTYIGSIKADSKEEALDLFLDTLRLDLDVEAPDEVAKITEEKENK